MNKKEILLAAEFLDKLDAMLSNGAYNGFEYPEDWTEEEKTVFTKEFYEENLDIEGYSKGDVIKCDSCVIYLLSEKLKKMASDV